MALPDSNPIDAEWFSRGTPLDHLGATSIGCPNCGPDSPAERYRAILGSYAGVGAPWFVKPFLKRQSTTGKTGRKSHWAMCRNCQALLPEDDDAKAAAAGFGLPDGFGLRD